MYVGSRLKVVMVFKLEIDVIEKAMWTAWHKNLQNLIVKVYMISKWSLLTSTAIQARLIKHIYISKSAIALGAG